MSGPTFFLNCWRRRPEDTNPAHWLMKIHKLFEISEVLASNKLAGQPKYLPTFQTMAFQQCASLPKMITEGTWPWGLHVFKAATNSWSERGLWKSLETTEIIELSANSNEWMCFEDLFFEVSYGMWFPAKQYQHAWQATLSKGLQIHQNQDRNLKSLQGRCSQRNLNIYVFQRSSGSPRAFRNLDNVVKLLESYTNVPIVVVTVNASSSVDEQARLFRSFDLLVTPHGSHIANIIFSARDTTAIIEVLPVVRDLAFQHTANDAEFASYVVSTGHLPILTHGNCSGYSCKKGKDLAEAECHYDKKSSNYVCPDPDIRSQLTSCDMIVDLDILRRSIEKSLAILCKTSGAGRNLIPKLKITRQ